MPKIENKDFLICRALREFVFTDKIKASKCMPDPNNLAAVMAGCLGCSVQLPHVRACRSIAPGMIGRSIELSFNGP